MLASHRINSCLKSAFPYYFSFLLFLICIILFLLPSFQLIFFLFIPSASFCFSFSLFRKASMVRRTTMSSLYHFFFSLLPCHPCYSRSSPRILFKPVSPSNCFSSTAPPSCIPTFEHRLNMVWSAGSNSVLTPKHNSINLLIDQNFASLWLCQM